MYADAHEATELMPKQNVLADPQCIIRTIWHANRAFKAPHRATEALCGMMTWPRTRSLFSGLLRKVQEVSRSADTL